MLDRMRGLLGDKFEKLNIVEEVETWEGSAMLS